MEKMQLVKLGIGIIILQVGCSLSRVSDALPLLNRTIFPADFVFGASSAAYQVSHHLFSFFFFLFLSSKYSPFSFMQSIFFIYFFLLGIYIYSMKVQLLKEAKDKAYGIILLTPIQVIIFNFPLQINSQNSLSLSLFNLIIILFLRVCPKNKRLS